MGGLVERKKGHENGSRKKGRYTQTVLIQSVIQSSENTLTNLATLTTLTFGSLLLPMGSYIT